ncbi:MAG: PilC/PilY family type IV pilus protein [Haliea sp.]
MNTFLNWMKWSAVVLNLLAIPALAEDIDIFAGDADVNAELPNVIFVLDNSSNWARQSQQWPGGLEQGQSEVRAIKLALQDQVGKLNVGFMKFTTLGNANENGGYVRFNLQELTESGLSQLSQELDSIFENINSPQEKRNSNEEYGNLMYDYYNYLSGGAVTFAGAGTPGSADSNAYTSTFSQFRSPLSSLDVCSNTYLIFIGNPNSSGPASDDGTNSDALKALYTAANASAPDALAGDSGVPLPLPGFTTVTSGFLGTSRSCWNDNNNGRNACTADENSTGGLCAGVTECSCTTALSRAESPDCQGNSRHYNVEVSGEDASTIVSPSGVDDTTSGRGLNLDDWSKFLYNYGVPVNFVHEGEPMTQRVPVVTYTIDVFNNQQNATHSGLLLSAAQVGGGRYFQARNESQIIDAISSALSDILSVSTSFAAVTLPLSTTNRTQQDNQVFIGMFRPAPGKKPRWFGNLKTYQIGLFDGIPRLADANLKPAVNPLTGFATECAASFWTEDSGNYWEGLNIQPPLKGQCLPQPATGDWSDLPDGPFVEKGGVAQMIRQAEARKIFTAADGALTALTEAAVGGQTLYDYLLGVEPGITATGTFETMPAEGRRPSIHGDIVHSRPLTVSYGPGKGVATFYGSNDGMYRAISAADGTEKWGLIAPEHVAKLERLYDNDPMIKYTGMTEDTEPEFLRKDYFFDGSTGQLIVYNDTFDVELAYIYPTMRRGGRMIYALDVTNPELDPTLLWRKGCPNLDNDTGCDTGMAGIGQTWSTPVGGFVGGYVDGESEPKPVIMFGGGYDDCLYEDTANYACTASAKGRGVYVLDAASGDVLKFFQTDGPVVGEVAAIDVARPQQDGLLEYAYVADAKGGLWRIDFTRLSGAYPFVVETLEPADWTITKIAETTNATRRFMSQPAVGVFRERVFVALGTGDRERPLEANYPYANEVQNRFYAFVDRPAAPIPEGGVVPVDLDGNTMLEVSTPPETLPEANPLLGTDGWYMDLGGRGEQVVNQAAIAGGRVFFNSYQPGGVNTGICTRPLGIAKGYGVSLFNPALTDGVEIAGGGMPIPPVIATVRPLIPPPSDCVGDACSPTEGAPITICIGCEGFNPVEIEPEAPPTRMRVYWTEEVDG